MPNNPPLPSPPSKEDFQNLSKNLENLRKDFVKKDPDSVPFDEEYRVQTNKLSSAIHNLNNTVRQSAIDASKSAAKYSKTVASKTYAEMAPNKKVQSGRMGAAGGLFGAIVAQAIADSGIGESIKRKTISSLKSLNLSEKNKNKKLEQQSINNKILSERGETQTKYHSSNTKMSEKETAGLLGNRYSPMLYSKAQNLKKSTSVISAVDRLRLSNQQMVSKSVAPSKEDVKKIKREAPKAALGGTVSRGGLAEVHQAEIIQPRKEVNKNIRLLSAIYSLLEDQNNSLDSLVRQYEDPNSNAGGFFSILKSGIRLLMCPVLGGMYTKDIQSSKNPLVTIASGIIEIHKWQRMYGELQKDQLNAILKYGYGGPQFDVRGRRGILFEWYTKHRKRLKEKIEGMEEGKTKKMAKTATTVMSFLNWNIEDWRKERAQTADAALSAAFLGEGGKGGFKGALARFWDVSTKFSEGFEYTGTRVRTFGEEIEETTKRIQKVQEEMIKKFQQLPEEAIKKEKATKKKFQEKREKLRKEYNDDFGKKEKDKWKKDWKKAYSAKKKTIDQLNDQLKKDLSKREAKLNKRKEFLDFKKPREAKLNRRKEFLKFKKPREVNDWRSGVGEVKEIVTNLGKRIIPSKDDTVVAKKKDKDETVTLLSKIKDLLQVRTKDEKTWRKKDIKKEEEEKKAAKKKSFWQSITGKGNKGAGGLINTIFKFLKGIATSLSALIPLIVLIAMNPKKALATLKWTFSETSNFLKMGWMSGKFVSLWGKVMKATVSLKSIGKVPELLSKSFSSIMKFFNGLGKFFKTFKTLGAKGAFKSIGKIGSKSAVKIGSKVAAKKIPVVGAILGLLFGINRFRKGDVVGGLGEIASGVASIFPGLGTAISLVIDGLLIARDIKLSKKKGDKNKKTGNTVADFFTEITETVRDFFLSIPKLIWTSIVKITKGIGKIYKWFYTEAIPGLFSNIVKMVTGLINTGIKVFFKSITDTFIKLPLYIAKVIGKFIKREITGISKIIKNIVSGTYHLFKWFYTELLPDMLSPSNWLKAMKSLGFGLSKVLNGLDEAIKFIAKIPVTMVEKLVNAVWKGLKSIGETIVSEFSKMTKIIITGIGDVLKAILPNALVPDIFKEGKKEKRRKKYSEILGTKLTSKQAESLHQGGSGIFQTSKGGVKDLSESINKRGLAGTEKNKEISMISNLYNNYPEESKYIRKMIEKDASSNEIRKTLEVKERKKETDRKQKNNKLLSSLFKKYGPDNVKPLLEHISDIQEVANVLKFGDRWFKEDIEGKEASALFRFTKNDKEKRNILMAGLKKGYSLEEIKKQIGYTKAEKSLEETAKEEKKVYENKSDIVKKKNSIQTRLKELQEKRESGFLSGDEMVDFRNLKRQDRTYNKQLNELKESEQYLANKKFNLKSKFGQSKDKKSTGKIPWNKEYAGKIPWGSKQNRYVGDWTGKINSIITNNGKKLIPNINDIFTLKRPNQPEVKLASMNNPKTEDAKQNEVQKQLNDSAAIIKVSEKLNKNIKESAGESAAIMSSSVYNMMSRNTRIVNNNSGGGGGSSEAATPFWKNIDSILGGNVI